MNYLRCFFFTITLSLLGLGCVDSTCDNIVDEQIECDPTGLLDALRSTAVDACEQSSATEAELQTCADCLEAAADCAAQNDCPCDFM